MIIKPVLTLAVVVAVIAVVAYPWAIPLPGRETLTGGWVGELRSNKGPRAWLYMNLHIASGYKARPLSGSTRLGDDAAVCTSQRRIALSIAGYTTAWSGERVDLLLRPVKPSPPELRFDVLGTWDGHTLELRESGRSLAETLNEPTDIAAVQSPGSSQWIAATLRRGTRSEFEAACATLGGRK
jgi:hypothetical protein